MNILGKKNLLVLTITLVLVAFIGLYFSIDKSSDNKEETTKKGSNIVVIPESTTEEESKSEVSDSELALNLVASINMGWNLGNTLDAWSKDSKPENTETIWGNPVTTKEMLDTIIAKGYKAIRIPVTYYNHIDNEGNIDMEWLQRIATLVNYVLEKDVYCVIDIHHDTGDKGYIRADIDNYNQNKEKVKNICKQIGEYFKDYDNKLILEGFNEMLDTDNKWSYSTKESYMALNLYNQLFVDTIRSTGGKNKDRNLLVNTYAASGEESNLSEFVIPEDESLGHLIVGVHYYGEKANDQDALLLRLKKKFIDNNIPVIIGEHATVFKISEETRISNITNFVKNAKAYNIPIFWWDDGNYKNEPKAQCNYALFDRVSMNFYHEALVDSMIAAANGN